MSASHRAYHTSITDAGFAERKWYYAGQYMYIHMYLYMKKYVVGVVECSADTHLLLASTLLTLLLHNRTFPLTKPPGYTATLTRINHSFK